MHNMMLSISCSTWPLEKTVARDSGYREVTAGKSLARSPRGRW